jgi:hypothetical protein
MVMPNWLTVLKWVGVVAAVVAVVGVPVWYINNKIDNAYERGKEVGYSECAAAAAKAATDAAIEAGKTIQEESTKAQELEEKNAKLQKNVTALQTKLADAVGKTPLPVGCVVNADATRLLGAAAAGNFDLSGASVPGQLDPKVPLDSTIRGEVGIKSS